MQSPSRENPVPFVAARPVLAGFTLSAIGVIVGISCLQQAGEPTPQSPPSISPPNTTRSQQDKESRFVEARRLMVEKQLRGRDITNPRVLEAIGRVPRQRLVPDDVQNMAYADHPLPIGHNQTISQPYIVALMTQVARPTPESRALEIGTGSGYQAAVLAELCKEVYSIEIVKPLADSSRRRLAQLGYTNVTIRCGDGYQGWPEHAPFDVILVTAAPDHVPQRLVDQLAIGGRLVIPVGTYIQKLLLLEKLADGSLRREVIAPVMFVPMTGEAKQSAGTSTLSKLGFRVGRIRGVSFQLAFPAQIELASKMLTPLHNLHKALGSRSGPWHAGS